MGHRAWIMGALGLMLTLAYTFLQIGSEEVPTWAMMIGGFGISLMLIFVGIERKTIVTQLSGQQNRNNLLAVGLVLILTGIAIGINVIAYQLDERWGLTSDQSFSLSPQTIAYLESIDEPVEVLAFFPDQSEEERYFRDLSATMSAHTDRLEVQVLDPSVSRPRRGNMTSQTWVSFCKKGRQPSRIPLFRSIVSAGTDQSA